jgi:hypothetical protein
MALSDALFQDLGSLNPTFIPQPTLHLIVGRDGEFPLYALIGFCYSRLRHDFIS